MRHLFANGTDIAINSIKILLVLGGIYWLWLAVQMKSFGMFLFGCMPPLWLITGPAGVYSFIFDKPSWVTSMFG